MDTETPYKFIDLFCGIGGFHQSLSNLGFQCVFACDLDEKCRETYFNNYHLQPMSDIREIAIDSIPDFDILCAGFPCQSFSKAGHQKGFNDERGNLFFSICKIVEKRKPKYLLLENVRNLASHDKGNTWNTIYHHINKLGYNTYDPPLILNTLHFNIPQFRERVIIPCKRKDLGPLPTRPVIPKKPTITAQIADVLRKNERALNRKLKITGKLKTTETVWNNFLHILIENNITIPRCPIWTDWWTSNGEDTNVTKEDKNLSEEENKTAIKKRQGEFYKKYQGWIDKNREFYQEHKSLLEPWLLESRAEPLWKGAVRKLEWQANNLTPKTNMNTVLWSPRGSGVRIKNLDYTPTLVAMASMIPIYGPESRMLSPRECLRLQSFPEDFTPHTLDHVAYKQAGNAVNVAMVERCARFLILEEPLFI